jgi:peptidoglycan/xylan/chitin deacetylase (PgdA/CDA1 family)
MDASPETLVRTIDLVLRRGLRIIPLPEAVVLLREGRVEDPCVVLTFDDGYLDFLDVVVPALRRYRLPATVSIVPDYVDSGRRLDFEGGGGRECLSWTGLKRALDDHGDLVTVANHSLRHRSFVEMTAPEIQEDLDRSQELIERNLGLSPTYFTYPFGARNEATDALVTGRFEAVLTGAWGPNHARAGKLLRRTAILESDGSATLDLKIHGERTAFQRVQELAFALGLHPGAGA